MERSIHKSKVKPKRICSVIKSRGNQRKQRQASFSKHKDKEDLLAFKDYNDFKVKVYDNWDLFLHANQFPYVGRCYAWAKREDARILTDMNKLERDELFDIVIPEWHQVIHTVYANDWYNVAFLGNETPHLHAHLIPRYHSPLNIQNIEFKDPNPKGNYAPYPKKQLPLKLITQIKEDIGSRLNKFSDNLVN
jgi:diadenosine tetraphosphate (Ap4A) HIT family hydrolase